jgi:3-deoxy-D-manno-octulosonic-acid transferase
MNLVYNITIFVLSSLIKAASLFNGKAKKFVAGRACLIKRIEDAMAGNQSRVIWIHCASLGEFEQGRPLIEAFKKEFPAYKIVLTFFSPSGFEVRKNFPLADFIFYLPWDTPSNAKRFIAAVRPTLTIFIKYEFWYHYSRELKSQGVPLLSVSSIFRRQQWFFKPQGGFMRRTLKNFSHLFVQNSESAILLKEIGITNVTQAGDTRFDRVNNIVKNAEPIPIAEKFKTNQNVFVIGSCWPEDLDVLIPFINENKLKFIIAPHEISETSLKEIENALQVKTVRYSEATSVNVEEYSVLLIDNIGMLSRLYRYGEFAFIGGAYGKGLHNILEAACYGIPVLFGNKTYEKFQEAVDLINRGGAFAVSDYPDLKAKYEMLQAPESFLLACEVTRQYVEENLGATEKIMQHCRAILNKNARIVL